jgi:trk system potassium uptake protein TrkA
VCAIGDDSRDASIICTALLRQMGARRVIARANDDVLARILSLVGAHEVVNPEAEFGERFANRLTYEHVLGELSLGPDLVLTELRSPPSFVGRTLAELRLPSRFGLTVVAVRVESLQSVLLPDPSRPVGDGDVLVVVSKRSDIGRMMERV